MKPLMEIFQEFGFDAAHRFETMPAGHPYNGIHGHSFTARVVVSGAPDPATGFVIDLGAVQAACADARDALDHRFLNEVEGLATPSLENLCLWLWARIKPVLPALTQVEVRRDASRHGCVFRG